MTEGCCSAADEQVARNDHSPDDHSPDDHSPDDSAARQRKAVRKRYARIATGGSSCGDDASEGDACCGEGDTCCGEGDAPSRPADYDRALGYTDADVEAVDDGANLRLGCGNPTAMAALRPGETVLDLGSGAGFDCFLAAREVGSSGRVVGVDMTPEMVEKARANARKNGTTNVEFRLGEIEHLPVAGASVSVVISNCVINLSPDKPQVFREAFRVLRPGGRLAVSDVVLTAEPPSDLKPDPDSVAACVGGASPISALEAMLGEAGFEDVAVRPKGNSEFVREWSDDRDLTEYLVSATIEGRKPEPSTAR